MRIVFDFEAVLKNRHSGFYTFGIGLLSGMAQLNNKPDMVLLCSKKFAPDAKQLIKNYTNWASIHSLNIKMRWLENFWSFSSLPTLQALTGPFDIFHSFHHLMPPTKPASKVLTVHDLRRYVLSEFYEKSKLVSFEKAVKNADHFIVVSESTKSDLCDILDIAQERVSVVHLACNQTPQYYNQQQRHQIRQLLQAQYNIKLDRYLLAFSSPDRRKNINRIIKAFQNSKSAIGKDLKLVVIGHPPKNELLAMGADIVAPGAVEDVRPWLVGCCGLVFASLYEGFGLPILEAFASGVPVITSDCSSMPEVAGDAPILVDPGDSNSIAMGITKLCNNPEQAKQFINRGYCRLQNFSWRKTAEETIKIYQRLL